MSAPQQIRPRPLRDAAKGVGLAVALAGSVVSVAVSFGLLTTAQGEALGTLAALIPGVVTAVTALLVAFGVARKAEPLVTPVADPAVEVHGELVSLVPQGRHARRE